MDPLGSRLAPITDVIGFVEADVHDVAVAILDQFAFSPRIDRVDGPLEDALRRFDPMNYGAGRYLVSATNSRWTAVFNDDVAHEFQEFVLAHRGLGRRAARFRYIRDTIDRPRGRYGMAEFSVWGPSQDGATESRDPDRVVYAAHDGDRWDFHAFGAVQPFEDVGRYEARRVRDRLTERDLVAYANAPGIRLDEESFYLNPRFLIVEGGARLPWRLARRFIHGPRISSFQRDNGIEPGEAPQR